MNGRPSDAAIRDAAVIAVQALRMIAAQSHQSPAGDRQASAA